MFLHIIVIKMKKVDVTEQITSLLQDLVVAVTNMNGMG